MSDVLSIAASIAGLLSLGIQTTEYLVTFYNTCKERDSYLTRTAGNIKGLSQIFSILREALRSRIWRQDEFSLLQQIRASIFRCEFIIKELEQEVDKFKKDAHSVRATLHRLSYPLRRSTLERLNEDVDECRSNLSFALQVLQLKSDRNLHDDVDAIKAVVGLIRTQQLSDRTQALQKWLKAPDATIDFNTAAAKRHAGTGLWFVKGASYSTWLEQNNSFRWLHGFAGCGKSVLCSTIIEHTYQYQRLSQSSALAIFFFVFNDESKQTASALLKALLLQLSGQIFSVKADLEELRDELGGGDPPIPALLALLRKAITNSHHMYLIFDALDECPLHTSRAEVLGLIDTIRKWPLSNLHLLVTSRDEPDIRTSLNSQTEQAIRMNDNDINRDIRDFLSEKLEEDGNLRRWGVHRQRIEYDLVSRAGGVFRWVECQLNPLRRIPKSLKNLESCLQSLPRSLDETYERMLCNIDDQFQQEQARRILTILCLSARPMHLAEIVDAIAVETEDEGCFDRDSRLETSEDLLRICPGMITVASAGFKDEDVLSIAHFSIQEYLESDRIEKGAAANFAISKARYAIKHLEISKACLVYLLDSDSSSESHISSLPLRYPFAKYASQYWIHHCRHSQSVAIPELQDIMFRFFTNPIAFDKWVSCHDFDRPWQYQDMPIPLKIFPRGSPIYYLALLGLSDMLRAVLRVSPGDIDEIGGFYELPLLAASARGHNEAVKILLQAGANVEASMSQCYDASKRRVMPSGLITFHNSLQASSYNGHKDVVQTLIDAGANVNLNSLGFGNALLAACWGNQKDVVKVLIRFGAKINHDANGTQENPLHIAIKNNNTTILQPLLDAGADVNIGQGSILQAAARDGNVQIIRSLLSAGADVNTEGGTFGTALHAAIHSSNQASVETLIHAGANIQAEPEGHLDALSTACQLGDLGMVQILVLAGAAVNHADGRALWSASASSVGPHQAEIVQTLLLAGADHRTSSAGSRALWEAANKGNKEVVLVLTGEGVDVNTRISTPETSRRTTALEVACTNGHSEVVQILLNAGADVGVVGMDRVRTILGRSRVYGHDF